MKFPSLFLSSLMLVGASACGGDEGSTSPMADAGPGADSGGPTTGCEGALPAFTHEGGTIDEATVWAAGEHTLTGSLYLDAALTIPACSVVRLPAGGIISVNATGALKLLGEQNRPVTVTSANAAPSAGDWAYIEFKDGSRAGNEIHYATVEYGGDDYGAIYVANNASVQIDHSTIRHSAAYGLEVVSGGELRNFRDNTITTSGVVPVKIHANSVGGLLDGTFTGNAADVIDVTGGTISASTSWKNLGVPFRSDTLYVAEDSVPTKLTLEAGVVLQLRPDSSITVQRDGALHLAGTPAAKVTITTNQASPSAGDWDYIEFKDGSTSAENIIENAIIEYGGKNYGAIYLADNASVQITDTTIRHSLSEGIEAAGNGSRLRSFTGNTITDCTEGPLVVRANTVADIGAGSYTGNGIEGIRIAGSTLERTATWADRGVPYILDGWLYVDATSGTATLTVGEGATVRIGNTFGITVQNDALLNLAGTSARRVTITSNAAAPVAGIWDYIELKSLGNVWSYADVSYGGLSSYGQLYLSANTSVTMTSVTFSDARVCDVDNGQTNATVSATGSTLTYCD